LISSVPDSFDRSISSVLQQSLLPSFDRIPQRTSNFQSEAKSESAAFLVLEYMEATLSSWCTLWFDKWVLISSFWLLI